MSIQYVEFDECLNEYTVLRLAYIENNDNKTLGKKLSYDAV